MKLYSVMAGYFKLDGGAMFGIVPKALWGRAIESDEQNRCTWAMRSLLIEEKSRLILIDTGLGTKQSEKFFSHYAPFGPPIEESLHSLGFSREDITDVFLTHLHFDHCGGAIYKKRGSFYPTFPNAIYWSNQSHWNWAIQPNNKEKASFLKENILPLQEKAQLQFIKEEEGIAFTSHISIRFCDGHTRAMMLPQIQYQGRTIVFVTDLFPSTHHIPLPWVMAYDVLPLQTIEEKKTLLEEAVENNYFLFFQHDAQVACCSLRRTDKDVRVDQTFDLEEIL